MTSTEAAAQQHNRRILQRICGVDPHRWPSATAVGGWQFDWWEVSFGEPGGSRLGVFDVTGRRNPRRCDWFEPEAVAAIDSAWPSTAIIVRCEAGERLWTAQLVRLPRMQPDDFDDTARRVYESAAAAASCGAICSGDDLVEGLDVFDAVAVGFDTDSGEPLNVDIEVRRVHREDSIGDVDWDLAQAGWLGYERGGGPLLDDDETWALACALGAMADRWCPLPSGDPQLASAASRHWKVPVTALDLDAEWFKLRRDHAGGDAVWWCAWCGNSERAPAPYLIGEPDGTVCCDAHLDDGACAYRDAANQQ